MISRVIWGDRFGYQVALEPDLRKLWAFWFAFLFTACCGGCWREKNRYKIGTQKRTLRPGIGATRKWNGIKEPRPHVSAIDRNDYALTCLKSRSFFSHACEMLGAEFRNHHNYGRSHARRYSFVRPRPIELRSRIPPMIEPDFKPHVNISFSSNISFTFIRKKNLWYKTIKFKTTNYIYICD